MSESTVIEPYGAIIVQSVPNFGISVWAYCSRTANPLASINSNECIALQLLTLALFNIQVRMYSCTKYMCFNRAMFKSENSLGTWKCRFVIPNLLGYAS